MYIISISMDNIYMILSKERKKERNKERKTPEAMEK